MTKILLLPAALLFTFTLMACAPQPKLAGNLAMTLKNYEQAAEEYQAALKSDPDSVTLLTGLGRAYYQLGEYDKAVDTFRHATEVESYPQASFYLGLSTIMSGNRQTGFDLLKQFRYAGNINVTNSVRDMAQRLEANTDATDEYIAQKMFQAWQDGLKKQ